MKLCIKMQSVSVFLDIPKYADLVIPGEKMLMPSEIKGCVT